MQVDPENFSSWNFAATTSIPGPRFHVLIQSGSPRDTSSPHGGDLTPEFLRIPAPDHLRRVGMTTESCGEIETTRGDLTETTGDGGATTESAENMAEAVAAEDYAAPPAKRGRGRPRKIVPGSIGVGTSTSLPSSKASTPPLSPVVQRKKRDLVARSAKKRGSLDLSVARHHHHLKVIQRRTSPQGSVDDDGENEEDEDGYENDREEDDDTKDDRDDEDEAAAAAAGSRKATLQTGFAALLVSHYWKHPIELSGSEYEVLDKTWILQGFKRSIYHRGNSRHVAHLFHTETKMHVIVCMAMMLDKLKRPQRYLSHLTKLGFKRVKFTQKSTERNILALAPFFVSVPPFVKTRPEFESFCGSLKVYYAEHVEVLNSQTVRLETGSLDTIILPSKTSDDIQAPAIRPHKGNRSLSTLSLPSTPQSPESSSAPPSSWLVASSDLLENPDPHDSNADLSTPTGSSDSEDQVTMEEENEQGLQVSVDLAQSHDLSVPMQMIWLPESMGLDFSVFDPRIPFDPFIQRAPFDPFGTDEMPDYLN